VNHDIHLPFCHGISKGVELGCASVPGCVLFQSADEGVARFAHAVDDMPPVSHIAGSHIGAGVWARESREKTATAKQTRKNLVTGHPTIKKWVRD
jgi:hypothetical protein